MAPVITDEKPVVKTTDAFSTFPKDKGTHLNDLKVTPEHKPSPSITSLPTLFPSLTYVVYVHRAIRNLVLTLAFDWTMPFFHPITFLLLVTVVPSIVIFLVVVEASLHIAFMFGLGNGMNGMATRWGGGLSPVNWWDPRIFGQEVSEIIKDGIRGLNQPVPNPYPNDTVNDPVNGGSTQTRSFNIDIAETCLLMSAIVYERDDSLVRSAHKKISEIGNNPTTANAQACEDINNDLLKSETRIHQQSDQWGLEFTSLSELNSLGGPFAGMFWSLDQNFIVVVFKGTTPTNFEDFLVDAMIQRVDARSFVFGEVHEGFYTSLFPQSDNAARANLASPYTSIIGAIRAKAREIKAANPDNDAPVNIWVTGHSLGAALGTLFYSRLLKSPQDLGPECAFRDAFLFGTPAIGDADFAAEYAAISHEPLDRHNTLWRVIDDTDIITKLPPGFDDITIRRFINKFSLLNYAHVGEGIRFFQDGRPPVSTRNLFADEKTPTLVKHETPSYSLSTIFGWNKLNNNKFSQRKCENGDVWHSKKDVFRDNPYQHKAGSPLIYIERLLPTFFCNHLPIRYFEAMQRARVYFEEDNEGHTNVVKAEKKE